MTKKLFIILSTNNLNIFFGDITFVGYPVNAESEGIKIKPEEMIIDKLYYCLFQNKVMLFYKDQNDVLNCYEIEEKEIVELVKQSAPEHDIESILQKFIEKENLNQ